MDILLKVKSVFRMLLCAAFLIVTLDTFPMSVDGSENASHLRGVAPDSVSVTLPDIDIVAFKQDAGLADTPVSFSSVAIDQIGRLGIADIKGVSDIVPNFFIPDYGSRITSSIYVRGIGARMDQPAVGLTVDNVPVLNKDAYDLDIADIAHIDMLRGPQSSLYGRNTMTGMINVRTISPLSFQGWKVMAEGALPAAVKASVGLYRRPTPDFGFGICAGVLLSHGRWKNLYNDKTVDRERSGNIRFKIDARVGSISVRNVLAASVLRQGGYPYEYIPTGEINYNDTCFYRRFLISDGVTLAWNIGRIRFTSVASLQYIDDNMTLDQDFLPLPYFTLTQKKRELSLTEDFMARGDVGGYSWLAGFFTFYRHNDMHAPVTFYDQGISSLIEEHRNQANPRYPIRWNSRSFTLNSDFSIPGFGVALYHESTLRLGDWRLSAGIRLDYERVAMTFRSHCLTGYDILDNVSRVLPVPAGTPVLRQAIINIDDSDRLHRGFLTLMPKFSALYSFPSGIGNLYTVIGKGYKAGGFNTQMFSDVLQQRLMNLMGIGSSYDVDNIVGYRPEKCWNFEIGSHLEFPALRLTADLSLFYIDIRDQQLTRFPSGSTTGRIMTNAGKTRSFGGELSMSWNPVGPLLCNLAYGFTDARFRKFNDGIADYDGKYLPYAPGNTLWVQSVYTLRAPFLGRYAVVFDINMRAAGRIFWNEQNTLSQPFYAILGASVALKSSDWDIQLWGRNLSDTRYSTFYFLSMGNEFLQRGNGISGGVTLRFSLSS